MFFLLQFVCTTLVSKRYTLMLDHADTIVKRALRYFMVMQQACELERSDHECFKVLCTLQINTLCLQSGWHNLLI
jgi:hypothetical protein